MKIGIDAKSLARQYTGISVYVSEVVRYLCTIDREDDFYLYSNKHFKLDFDLPDNFHIRKYKALTGTIGILTNLPSIMKKDGIDVFWGTEHCIPIGKQSFKRVVTYHDMATFSNYKLGTRYNYLLMKFVFVPSLKFADKVIAISESTKRDVGRYVDLNRIDVVYNGDSPYTNRDNTVSKEEELEIFKKFEIMAKHYFLFVGSIEPRKNIVTIVEAFEKYKSRNVNGHKLILAGGLGWRYSDILRKIESSPFKKDIRLL